MHRDVGERKDITILGEPNFDICLLLMSLSQKLLEMLDSATFLFDKMQGVLLIHNQLDSYS